MRCKQHQFQHYLLSFISNVIRECTACGLTQVEVGGRDESEWKDVTLRDMFGEKIFIVTGSKYSFDASRAFLAEDYNLPPETFHPLLTDADFAEFSEICDKGGRPCVILNPTDWFENGYLHEWNMASALSSNIGGAIMRPLKVAGDNE